MLRYGEAARQRGGETRGGEAASRTKINASPNIQCDPKTSFKTQLATGFCHFSYGEAGRRRGGEAASQGDREVRLIQMVRLG